MFLLLLNQINLRKNIFNKEANIASTLDLLRYVYSRMPLIRATFATKAPEYAAKEARVSPSTRPQRASVLSKQLTKGNWVDCFNIAEQIFRAFRSCTASWIRVQCIRSSGPTYSSRTRFFAARTLEHFVSSPPHRFLFQVRTKNTGRNRAGERTDRKSRNENVKRSALRLMGSVFWHIFSPPRCLRTRAAEGKAFCGAATRRDWAQNASDCKQSVNAAQPLWRGGEASTYCLLAPVLRSMRKRKRHNVNASHTLFFIIQRESGKSCTRRVFVKASILSFEFAHRASNIDWIEATN